MVFLRGRLCKCQRSRTDAGRAELPGHAGSCRLPSPHLLLSPTGSEPGWMPEQLPALLARCCRAPVLRPGFSPAVANVTCSTQLQVKHEPRGWCLPHRSQPHAAHVRSWTYLCSLTLKSKLLYVFSHKKKKKSQNFLSWMSKHCNKPGKH